MSVINQVPETAATANGLTRTFPFDFLIPSINDLVVSVSDVLQTAGFSVTGLGTSSGNVTFDVAPAAGVRVVIQRQTVLERPTDYQQHGDFRSQTVNADFDRPMLALQEMRTRLGRAILSAVGELGVTLPSGIDNPNRVLGTDDFGNLIFTLPGSGTQLAMDLVSSAAGKGAALVTVQSARTGSIARLLSSKLDDFASSRDFGLIGAGDETVALQKFWQSAIDNPNVPHHLDALTYLISAALPTINVSNIKIEAVGSTTHDAGSVFSGPLIRWIGSAGVTMASIIPINGASAQRLAGITLRGIGFDANSIAARCVRVESIVDSSIDIAVANATVVGASFSVTATLGEAKDLQKNNIRVTARQVEAPNGAGVEFDGDTIANVSMNRVHIDAQHVNVPALRLINSDNNTFKFFRAYKTPGGAATEAVSCLGGASSAVGCRDEVFQFYSANTPVHAFGTGSYPVAATSIRIEKLDTANGTPDPVIDTGASVFYDRSRTPFGDSPWVPYVPVLTATTGTFTSAVAAGRYLQRGRICYVEVTVTITTNGTAAGAVIASLPFLEAAGVGWEFSGKETAVAGFMTSGLVAGSTTQLTIQKYDGTYPGGNGYVIRTSGFYEVA